MLKRAFEILVASCLLALLSIPIAIICLILLLTNEHEVFFFQDRVGLGGKLFRITKFVTMRKDSPETGTRDITLPNDPCIFPFGRFLRKTKLNELPQLFDVFMGRLALVGWRPLLPQGFADYPAEVQREIIKVKPGLTGIGSLVFRDEERIVMRAQQEGKDLRACYREDILPYKGALEVWYVQHAGLWTDLKILFATLIAVLRPGWSGFYSWFRGLPRPQQGIVSEVLAVEP